MITHSHSIPLAIWGAVPVLEVGKVRKVPHVGLPAIVDPRSCCLFYPFLTLLDLSDPFLISDPSLKIFRHTRHLPFSSHLTL